MPGDEVVAHPFISATHAIMIEVLGRLVHFIMQRKQLIGMKQRAER